MEGPREGAPWEEAACDAAPAGSVRSPPYGAGQAAAAPHTRPRRPPRLVLGRDRRDAARQGACLRHAAARGEVPWPHRYGPPRCPRSGVCASCARRAARWGSHATACTATWCPGSATTSWGTGSAFARCSCVWRLSRTWRAKPGALCTRSAPTLPASWVRALATRPASPRCCCHYRGRRAPLFPLYVGPPLLSLV